MLCNCLRLNVLSTDVRAQWKPNENVSTKITILVLQPCPPLNVPNASFYKWNSTTLLPKAAMGAEVPSSPLACPSQLSCLFPPVSDSLSWGTFCLLFPLVLPSVHETKIWASAPEYSNTGAFQRKALDNWNIENVTNAIHLLRPLLVTSWLQSIFSKTIHSKKKACKD